MTSNEVTDIIKGAKGDINIVAKRRNIETISATVYKGSADTKVGLTVVAKEGKVYVTNLRFLFENSGKARNISVYRFIDTFLTFLDSKSIQ